MTIARLHEFLEPIRRCLASRRPFSSFQSLSCVIAATRKTNETFKKSFAGENPSNEDKETLEKKGGQKIYFKRFIYAQFRQKAGRVYCETRYAILSDSRFWKCRGRRRHSAPTTSQNWAQSGDGSGAVQASNKNTVKRPFHSSRRCVPQFNVFDLAIPFCLDCVMNCHSVGVRKAQ